MEKVVAAIRRVVQSVLVAGNEADGKTKNDMHGKIWFRTLEDMTGFLIGIVGKTTATWEAREVNGRWVVEFQGGY